MRNQIDDKVPNQTQSKKSRLEDALSSNQNRIHTGLWLRLFCNCFCIYGATNAAKCLVTNKTMFCIARPTKKLSLKRSFCEVVFTCFFN